MSDAPKPKFDPVKLEQLNVATDYPMEKDEFEKLFEHNCYCEMAHVNSKGFPIVTPMFYVVIDGILHMSSIKKYRHKVHHLEQNPKIFPCPEENFKKEFMKYLNLQKYFMSGKE